jgi:hypothetical protein
MDALNMDKQNIPRPPLWSNGQSSWLQNGDVLCFLWSMNRIYICYVEESRPLLWSSDQSSWLQIQESGFDSRRYQIFWVVGLERGPLSLLSTIEALLGRTSSGSGQKAQNTVVGIRHADHATPSYPQKLAITSPTNGCRSVGIVRSLLTVEDWNWISTQREVLPLEMWAYKSNRWESITNVVKAVKRYINRMNDFLYHVSTLRTCILL